MPGLYNVQRQNFMKQVAQQAKNIAVIDHVVVDGNALIQASLVRTPGGKIPHHVPAVLNAYPLVPGDAKIEAEPGNDKEQNGQKGFGQHFEQGF